MADHSIVFCTTPQGEKGKEIAHTLVSEKLAACVNIVPHIQSIYTWKGSVCNEAESLLVIKTKTNLIPALMEKIRALHPYEVPEIISFDITKGLSEYLVWIDESTQ